MGSSSSKEKLSTEGVVSRVASNATEATTLSLPSNEDTDSKQATTTDSKATCPVSGQKKTFLGFGCPHKFDKKKKDPPPQQQESLVGNESACPVKKQQQPAASGCPVKNGPQYNVYSQPIDPTNQMPSVANQMPSPTQKELLPTNRVASTIPKGNADDGVTWTYPSPQMFYNALSRKGKLEDGTSEQDMESVVALHNNMNERTWRKVMEWEQTIGSTEESPRLLKFMGRPTDLSPKARLKHYLLGHPLPFDRHDWTVQRSDGTEVRYVIDYYYDDTRAKTEEGTGMPDLHSGEDGSPSLLVDVRPAVDSLTLAWSRLVTMPVARTRGISGYEYLPLAPTMELKTQVAESQQVWASIQQSKKPTGVAEKPTISEKEAMALSKAWSEALKDCQQAQKAMSLCRTDDDCARASVDLTVCFGKLLCPLQHKSLTEALAGAEESDAVYEARVEKALEGLQSCVSLTSKRNQQTKEQHPELFAS